MSVTTRFVEGTCGVLAGVWGVLVEANLVIRPIYAYLRHAVTGSSMNGMSMRLPPVMIISLTILTILLVLIASAAVVDSRSRSFSIGFPLVIVGTLLLTIYTYLAMFSIGILLIPSVLLSIVAAVLAGFKAPNPEPARHR